VAASRLAPDIPIIVILVLVLVVWVAARRRAR
jgi:hypothetical protein